MNLSSSFKATKKKAEFSLESLEEDCIPYACHYDENTILTKNGEVMQVIKIEGASEDALQSENIPDLRASIRQAVMQNITDRKFAIWFHTIRRKRNLDTINYYSWTFARDTHEAWAAKNHWHDKYVNELYVTILYEGAAYDSKNNILLSFLPKALKKYHLDLIKKNVSVVTAITDKMLQILNVFNAKRLKVSHDVLGVHSEILEFLTKIICLSNKRVAIPIQSIDSIFCRNKIAFGGNALEIYDENEKHFAAVFTIKEYHEFSANALDKLLRTSSEYVITQTLNFVDAKEAKKSVEYFDYILGISKDQNLRQHSDLAGIMDSDQGKPTDFAIQQMSCMVLAETLPELQRSVENVTKEMSKLGIVVIREDLSIALCYWSQLPGNFNFFRRNSYINTKKTASFASLHNAPSGRIENIWGKAITIFRRADGSPHFFNLHNAGSGHTMIVGPADSAKGVLTNFILSESSKYNPQVVSLNQYGTSRVTIKALGGEHTIIDSVNHSFARNPFIMEDNQENLDFLRYWLLLVAFPDGKYNEDQKNIIFEALEQLVYAVPYGDRKISKLLEFIDDEAIKAAISTWCIPNKFGILFDHDYDAFDFGVKMIGFDVSFLMQKEYEASIAPFVSYCMNKFTHILDGSPAIIVINDANTLLKNEAFASFLPGWLDYLTAHNAIAIFVCDTTNEFNNNIKLINDKIATHLFLPHNSPKDYQQALRLTDEEISMIKEMKLLYRNFMIKQGARNIIVELNLDGMNYAIKALEGKKDAVEAMENAIKSNGENPNSWIIPFYKNLFPELHS